MRTRSDRLVAVATLGAFVVVAGVLGLVSLYLGAVTQALSGMQRTESLPEYQGRPTSAVTDGTGPMRYLVLVTDEHGDLASAYLAQLSGGRDALQLIGLPANLLVQDSDGADTTLATLFTPDGSAVVRAVETMFDLRLDHLVAVDLEGFTRLIDVVDGVTVSNRTEIAADGLHFGTGDLRLTGSQAEVYLGASKQPMVRLERTQAVVLDFLKAVAGGDALTNPAKVETIGQVLHDYVRVDADLTSGEIRRMALDARITSDTLTAHPLPLAGVSLLRSAEVTVPDAARVQELAEALNSDQVAAWVARQTDPWPELGQLPPR